MNTVEQRTHKTVTGSLRNDLDALAEIVTRRTAALERRQDNESKLLRDRIAAEREDREHSVREQAEHLARHQAALEAINRRTEFAVDLVQRGFWGRLNWLITGQ
jgi:hypothetical protein